MKVEGVYYTKALVSDSFQTPETGKKQKTISCQHFSFHLQQMIWQKQLKCFIDRQVADE